MTITVPPSAPARRAAPTWVDVCPFDDLVPDRGVCALVGGQQVAVFRVAPDDQLFAIANRDPFSGANVLSRGIVGSKEGTPKVASPMYKQCFDLATGEAIGDPAVRLRTFPVRVQEGRVEVGVVDDRAP